MVFIGMIYQFDSTQGSGLIMLSDGEKREFSSDDWVDASNMPAVGLKVSYESSDGLIKIKVASEADKNKALSDEKQKSSKEEDITSFTSIQEYQTYFSNKGFDLIKNSQEHADDELTMGRFDDESVEIVSITFKDSQAQLTEKTMHLSSLDDYIKYFTDIGFRLIKDSEDSESRTLILRRYVMDKHGEIIIKQSDCKISVSQTVNGKKVVKV